MTKHQTVTVHPVSDVIGAEVRGVDLASINDDDFATLYAAWLDHQVVLVRNQTLDDSDLVAFSQQRHRKRRGDRQSGGRGSGLAYGYELSACSADGEHAALSGNPGSRREDRVHEYVCRL